jgi:hypothetical protein
MTHDPRDEAYERAQYCVGGHLITSYATSFPDETQDRCDRCGSPTITACPKCQAIIRGDRLDRRASPTRPAYCHHCGEPFPWTTQALAAAKELAQSIEAPADEKRIVEESIVELVNDGPAMKLAAVRFKAFLAKAGTTAAGMFRDILVDVLSEAAKKLIWPEAPPVPSRRR